MIRLTNKSIAKILGITPRSVQTLFSRRKIPLKQEYYMEIVLLIAERLKKKKKV